MYTEYAKEADEDILYYDQVERTSDIQLPPVINTLLLVTWVAIFLVGFVVIYLVKNPLLGALIIAIPTFIGMVIKPTFALCMMMLVLPTGAGVGYGQMFSLDRGVGIALAVSFLLNLMVSRPSLHIRNKALWVLVIYTIWIFFSSLAAPYASLELWGAFTQFQILTLVLTVYWILQTNSEKTLRWALRAYVIGTLGTIIIAYRSGAAMISMEEAAGRYAATLGRAIDENMLAALVSMAFLAAIYLFACDKQFFWRLIYLGSMAIFPLMLIRIASRGALVAMAFTLLSPLLFIRQILRKPALTALLLVVILLASVSTALLVKKKGLEPEVAHRLTDIQYAKSSIDYRLDLFRRAAKCAIKYPAGTGYFGWVERAGTNAYPHGDFFFALGIHGIPAAMIFMFFVITMMFTIKRMLLGLEKLYARAVLTFLLVMGLNIGQLYQKHFWVFLTIIMGIERISRLKSSATEYLPNEIDEETTGINY
jgi:hypothetical protein